MDSGPPKAQRAALRIVPNLPARVAPRPRVRLVLVVVFAVMAWAAVLVAMALAPVVRVVRHAADLEALPAMVDALQRRVNALEGERSDTPADARADTLDRYVAL